MPETCSVPPPNNAATTSSTKATLLQIKGLVLCLVPKGLVLYAKLALLHLKGVLVDFIIFIIII
jgi:hypothetical protein